jgi:hypothetical protein
MLDRRALATSAARRVVELADLAFASPAAKSRGAGGKLPWPASFRFDHRTFCYEAKKDVGRSGERQKQLLGGGTASRPVQNRDLQVP